MWYNDGQEVTGMNKIDPVDMKALIKQTKEQIHRLKQQIAETADPVEKRTLKRRLAKYQRQQLGYLGKLGWRNC